MSDLVELVDWLMVDRERLRVALYAIAHHPGAIERIRAIAVTALEDVPE